MNTTCEVILDLQNTTDIDLFVYLPFEKTLLTVILPCVILAGLIGNILLIWTVIRISDLHTSTYIFLASLASADIGTLLGYGTNFITDVLSSPVRYSKVNAVYLSASVLSWFCSSSSFGFVTLVSLERYFAICHPIRHRLLKGFGRTLKLIALVLLFGLVVSALGLYYHLEYDVACVLWPNDPEFLQYPSTIHLSVANYQSRSINVQLGDIAASCAMTFMSIGNIIMSIRILKKLKQRRRSNVFQTSAQLEKTIQQVSLMVTINGMVYHSCFTILSLMMISHAFHSLFEIGVFSELQYRFVPDVAFSVMILNASVSPLIYLIVNQRYRHDVITSFKNLCPGRYHAN